MPRFGGLHAFEESIELFSQSIEFRLRSFLKSLEMINRNQDCPWRVVLSDQDSRPLDRLLEQTSKFVLCFGSCVGSLCSPAVLVARNITLPLRRNLLDCVMILHDGILAIMAKTVNGFTGRLVRITENEISIETLRFGANYGMLTFFLILRAQ